MIRLSGISTMVLCAVAFLAEGAAAQGLWGPENLVGDRKIGKYDLVTVVIREKSRTTTTTETETAEESQLDTAVTQWFTNQGTAVRPQANPTTATSQMPSARGGHSRERENEGEISHAETFEARITARIIEIMPNGNLVLEARKSVHVGEEESTLIFTGEVRRKDVADDNTIDSDRVADAQIIYKGRGVVTDANRRGWLAKIFDFLNIF